MKRKTKHVHWMQKALQEASKATKTSPNPKVGAVLVKSNQLLSKAYHRGPGKPHAEIEALKKTKVSPKGATLFVTLEPCCHKDKRTPPCVPEIIKSGIKKVIIGSQDPNPKVRAKGVATLRRAGIKVEWGILQAECEALNAFYYHFMQHSRPYTILKMASSLDGKVALASGLSKWITSQEARAHAHQLRAKVDAILVGASTVVQDNPQLNAREGKLVSQPKRIILDPNLKTPLHARVFKNLKEQPTYLVTRKTSLKKPKASRLQEQGVQLLACPMKRPKVLSLSSLLKKLAGLEIQSLMVEGGPHTWAAFVQQKAYEEVWHYLAPKFLGGEALSLMGRLSRKTLPQLADLDLLESQSLGSDLWLRYGRV